ncbi:unnamed protein product, partial [Linum tenue]
MADDRISSPSSLLHRFFLGSPSSSFTPYGLEQVSRFFSSSPSSVTAAASPVNLTRRDIIGDKLHELYNPFFPRSHHSLSLP